MEEESQRRAYRRFYETVYVNDHPSQYGGADSDGWHSWVDSTRLPTVAWLQRLGLTEQATALVLELGCGGGYLKEVHLGWLGLEFSLSALERIRVATSAIPSRLLNADMQTLPLRSASVDFVFSWAAIEHVPHPERVMAEVERVLKPGGVALLAPAWNCRSWTTKRLQVRPYAELSWPDRLEKAVIPVRNSLVWRGLGALPFRLKREIAARLFSPIEFDYRPLSPDFSTTTEHITDDDAYASMDPHAAILYFKSRQWEILSQPTLLKRLLVTHQPVVVRKPV